MIEDIDRDVFVRIQTDLLVVGDSIMTDRHHASNGNYEDDDPQNQIGGIIPAFPLSGWLRHGMERVVSENDGTACHPGESNANFMKEDVYERDLDDGYHETMSGLTRVGNYSKYGFGELRVKPVTPDETNVKKQIEKQKSEH